MTCSGVNSVQLYCTVHTMLALYQDYCVCAKKISPSGRLTYWGVLNTWSHPSKTSNKSSHYQTIQLLYKRPVCLGWLCIVLGHISLICRCRCYVLRPVPGKTAWTEEHVAQICQEKKFHTCCIHPFVAHLSPAAVCVCGGLVEPLIR